MLDREDHELFFWRTHAGAELDLFWQWGGRAWGVECTYRDAPRLTRSIKTTDERLTAILNMTTMVIWLLPLLPLSRHPSASISPA
jgi:hypothetical protein